MYSIIRVQRMFILLMVSVNLLDLGSIHLGVPIHLLRVMPSLSIWFLWVSLLYLPSLLRFSMQNLNHYLETTLLNQQLVSLQNPNHKLQNQTRQNIKLVKIARPQNLCSVENAGALVNPKCGTPHHVLRECEWKLLIVLNAGCIIWRSTKWKTLSKTGAARQSSVSFTLFPRVGTRRAQWWDSLSSWGFSPTP